MKEQPRTFQKGIIYLFTHYRKHPASNRIARVSALIVASAASDRVSDSIKSASVASSYGLNIASMSMSWLAFRVAFMVASEARYQSTSSSGGTILPARSMSALSLALRIPGSTSLTFNCDRSRQTHGAFPRGAPWEQRRLERLLARVEQQSLRVGHRFPGSSSSTTAREEGGNEIRCAWDRLRATPKLKVRSN